MLQLAPEKKGDDPASEQQQEFQGFDGHQLMHSERWDDTERRAAAARSPNIVGLAPASKGFAEPRASIC
jgi:hypothetical protein